MTFEELNRRCRSMLFHGASSFEVQQMHQKQIHELVHDRLSDLSPKLGEAKRELRKLTIMSARADIDGMPISENSWVQKVQDANLLISCLEQEMEDAEYEVYKALGLS